MSVTLDLLFNLNNYTCIDNVISLTVYITNYKEKYCSLSIILSTHNIAKVTLTENK